MKEKMKVLIALQDCDTRIRTIRMKKEEWPGKIKGLEKRLAEMENQLQGEADRIKEYARNRRNAEQEIEEVEIRLKKAETKLSNIKSNKEYEAALREIDELKTERSLMEDRVIEILEKAEALEQRHTLTKRSVEDTRRQFQLDRDEILKKIEGLDRDLQRVEKDRLRLSRTVDPDLLKRYDTLRTRKGGIAVSPVVKGVCQTCHLGIPPQEFNELLRGDRFMTCPNCSRIIYWGEDENYQNEASA